MVHEVWNVGLVLLDSDLAKDKNRYFWRLIDEVDHKALRRPKHWRI
jgi:hypothetical protein